MSNHISVIAAIADHVFPGYTAYRFDDNKAATARASKIQVAGKTDAIPLAGVGLIPGAIVSHESPLNLGESRVKLKARSLNVDHLRLNGDHSLLNL